MQRKNSNRIDRVNEEFKRVISTIIDQNLKNPNITGLISVTKVKTSSDLKSARVYVSILGSKSKKNTLDGLKNARGFIRTELANRVNLRYTPELNFELDETLEYGAKIDGIINELNSKKGLEKSEENNNETV